MAIRERKKNPCRWCGEPFSKHAHSADCALTQKLGACDCESVERLWPDPVTHEELAECEGYEEARIFRASPSSVKSYGQCQRKWASRALGGVKKTTPAQAFGDVLHGMAECYLLTGAIPDQDTPEGRLFIEGIPHLPKRRLGADEVEGEIDFSFDGVPWIGYYDWIERDRQLIGDHKTSSDPKRWGLAAKDLPDDIQACTYAWHTGWTDTNLRWLYYSKKSRNAYPVDATVSRQHAEQVVRSYSPITREMQKLFDANPATLTVEQLNQIPNDPQSCDMCGRGCDFAEHCTLIKPSALVREKLVGKELEEAQVKNMAASDRIAEIRAKLAAKKNGEAVNPPEGKAAAEDTVKEVANEVPAAAAEPEKKEDAPELKAEPKKAKKSDKTDVAPVAAEPATGGKVSLDLGALGTIAANLPDKVKITITLG